MVYGQPAAWNPVRGWQPLHIENNKISELVSCARLGQSISSLRDLIQNGSGDGTLHWSIPAALVSELNKIMNYPTPRIVVQISRGSIVGIVDQVRSMVLDWAIEMERQGIVGDGMSFSTTEREEAKLVMANINVGSIGSFIGNMGNGSTSGDINASNVSSSQIKETVSRIREALPDLKAAGINDVSLSQIIDDIAIEAGKETPKSGRMRELLVNAKDVLIGAAGNLTAEGAISGINALLKALG